MIFACSPGDSQPVSSPTSVYLYFDSADILVYVGVTSRGIARQREHNTDKEWWSFVARQEVEHYPTRAQALRRERDLIELLTPPFNSVHNPNRAAREAYLAIVSAGNGTSAEPENKWIPMRVGLQRDGLLVVLTRNEYASATSNMSTTAAFTISASGHKVRDVEVRRIGSTVVVAMRIKTAPPCVSARLKYRHVPGGREIKCLDLIFVSGDSRAEAVSPVNSLDRVGSSA